MSRRYTTGELNRTVDALFHPLGKLDTAFLLLDGIIHGIIERNPPKSIAKFIHHNLPKLVAQLVRSRKGSRRARPRASMVKVEFRIIEAARDVELPLLITPDHIDKCLGLIL